MKQNNANLPTNILNGMVGEVEVVNFLLKRGHSILSRNYRKKWGELDIVSKYKGKVHFIEVKSVSRESLYRPEDNLHPWKIKRLKRAIQTYLIEKFGSGELVEWQFDVAVVVLSNQENEKVSFMEDIII